MPVMQPEDVLLCVQVIGSGVNGDRAIASVAAHAALAVRIESASERALPSKAHFVGQNAFALLSINVIDLSPSTAM